MLPNLNTAKEICNNFCSMLTSVRRPCDLGYSIWSCSIIWNKNELFQYMQLTKFQVKWQKLRNMLQTWLKLDPNTSIILDLFNHLSISSNYNTYSKSWYWNLKITQQDQRCWWHRCRWHILKKSTQRKG